MKHDWALRVFQRMTLSCCCRCGIVQNALNAESPCKGDVKVAMRAEQVRGGEKGNERQRPQ